MGLGPYVDIELNEEDDSSFVTSFPAFAPGRLKIHFDGTDVDLTSTHQDIFSVTNNGRFFGFAAEFDSDRINIRLEIDGQEVFDFNIRDDLETFVDFGQSKYGVYSVCKFFRRTSSDKIEFCPPFPIAYETGFKIQARETSGSRELEWINVYYTERS